MAPKRKIATLKQEALDEGRESSPTLITSTGKNIPAFLSKLYDMVQNQATNHLIHWNKEGTTFIVENPDDFAAEVLPMYFKHSNFSSFVRQLNMYGFHKVPHVQSGSLMGPKDIDVSTEFVHPNFQRNSVDALAYVSRKRKDDDEGVQLSPGGTPINVSTLIQELANVKRHQSLITNEIKQLEMDNQRLWNDTKNLRQQYAEQQQTIDKIIQFLASIFTGKKALDPSEARRMVGPSNITTVPSPDTDEDEPVEEISQQRFDQLVRQPMSLTRWNPTSPTMSTPLVQEPGAVIPYVPNELTQALQGLNAAPPSAQLSDNTLQLNDTSKAATTLEHDISALEQNLITLSQALGIDLSQLQKEQPMEVDQYLQDHALGGSAEDQATLLRVMQSNPNLWPVIPETAESQLSESDLWNVIDDGKMVNE